jgi:hypothetical protein
VKEIRKIGVEEMLGASVVSIKRGADDEVKARKKAARNECNDAALDDGWWPCSCPFCEQAALRHVRRKNPSMSQKFRLRIPRITASRRISRKETRNQAAVMPETSRVPNGRQKHRNTGKK